MTINPQIPPANCSIDQKLHFQFLTVQISLPGTLPVVGELWGVTEPEDTVLNIEVIYSDELS